MLQYIKTFFKELFCSHIYKTVDVDDCGIYKSIGNVGGFVDITYWRKSIHYDQCVKCGKERIHSHMDFVSTSCPPEYKSKSNNNE